MMELELANVHCGFEIEQRGATPKLIDQIHGGKIVEYSAQANPLVQADGIWTKNRKTPLWVFTADCIPLLFFDNNPQPKIAAIHCGWRGAKARIAEHAANLLGRTGLTVVIGPSILKCCFEVKNDLVESFESAGHQIKTFLERRNGKMYFDLLSYVETSQLQDVKVNKAFARCTACSSPKLPSYRRNKDTDPRIKAFIVSK